MSEVRLAVIAGNFVYRGESYIRAGVRIDVDVSTLGWGSHGVYTVVACDTYPFLVGSLLSGERFRFLSPLELLATEAE